MGVETLYRVICGKCERYLPRDSATRKALEDSASAELFVTESSAQVAARARGWAGDPLRCPYCWEVETG